MRNIRTRRTIILLSAAVAAVLAVALYVTVPSGVNSMEIRTASGDRLDTSLTVISGSETQLECRVYPGIFNDRTTEYSIDDEDVATVDASGLLKGLKMGDTVLTVRKAGVKMTIDVTVQPSVKTIEGLPSEITLLEGDGYFFEPKVIMTDKAAEAPKVTYKSKRSTVAKVDEDGYVLAQGLGKTRIIVKAGAYKKEIPVTVIFR